jgi:uncharacterized membrane protein YphA (DoxX/SURF4 family)
MTARLTGRTHAGRASRPARWGTVRVTTKEDGDVKSWATRETRTELLMACLRVAMGAIFLAVWSDNLIKGYYSPGGWADFVQHYADTTKVSLYADILNKVMIPNSTVFAYGQFGMEFVVFGLFLVLGLFTPVSALLAALFQLNLLVATSGTADWPGTYIIMFVLLLAISLSQAGRTLGLDALLARRDPRPRLPLY